MSSKKSKLFTEEEIGYERVFEIRILDLRQRDGVKQKSFSLSVKRDTKNSEYDSPDQLKERFKRVLREKKYV